MACCLEVHHGEAGEEAVLGGLDNALLHRRDEVPGDGPAEDLVGELELGAARQRLHLDPAIAELAMAAGLLLVASLDVGGAADGLAVGDLGSFEGHVHAVTLLQPADHDFDVLLA